MKLIGSFRLWFAPQVHPEAGDHVEFCCLRYDDERGEVMLGLTGDPHQKRET